MDEDNIIDIDMVDAVVIVEQTEANSPGIETEQISDDEIVEAYVQTKTNQSNNGANNDHSHENMCN